MTQYLEALSGTITPEMIADCEIAKVQYAVKYGADTVMDLSTGKDIDLIRRSIILYVPSCSSSAIAPFLTDLKKKIATIGKASKEKKQVTRAGARKKPSITPVV